MHKTAVNNVTRFSSSYLRRHVSKAGGSQRCSPKIMTAENNIHNACKGQQVCGISPILFNLLMLSCCLGFWIIQLVCSQAMDRKQPPGTDLLTSPVYLSYDRLALHHGSAANPSTTPPFMPNHSPLHADGRLLPSDCSMWHLPVRSRQDSGQLFPPLAIQLSSRFLEVGPDIYSDLCRDVTC